ncbi:MAG: MFS transporter, partial [Flavobacteriaceae bacterium]
MKELPFRKSHPKGLYTLFSTEMWERFSYYGMRALLVLYLTAELVNGGFGLGRQEALELYAVFTGLVYLTPILGGWISDRYFGQRKTVYIGGLVMAIGQFLLAASALLYQTTQTSSDSRQFLFNFGLGVLIIGNGFFKPNISTVVGEFYHN